MTRELSKAYMCKMENCFEWELGGAFAQTSTATENLSFF